MSLANGSKSFATLLRNSKFITHGDFRNSLIIGKVFHVMGDDLYVDIGMKFHAVVKRPQHEGAKYVRGSNVRLRLMDYELTDKFIGTKTDYSLLEADAILLGLESTPIGSKAGDTN